MYKGWWLAVESLSYRYRFYVDNLLAGVLFVLLRIFCLCHLSLLCVSLGFIYISVVSLSECPRLQPNLYLSSLSLNGLNICFSLGVGFPGKLHVIILSIDDLLINTALSIHAILMPLLPVLLVSIPRHFHSLVIHSSLSISTALSIPLVPISLNSSLLKTPFLH